MLLRCLLALTCAASGRVLGASLLYTFTRHLTHLRTTSIIGPSRTIVLLLWPVKPCNTACCLSIDGGKSIHSRNPGSGFTPAPATLISIPPLEPRRKRLPPRVLAPLRHRRYCGNSTPVLVQASRGRVTSPT
ncbi:hypothetical protein P154DRAFT_342896 [Amniculicola lignicola CBS 123094]|uniref:Secreted protein n=1 Tax=Amniculicola lignicola CBS 123094 TaxID=1392246 RepID=A0A6A5W6D3_9PLEO|nr:hypothetical protein P154DRAFT_342896 [Amniculicola lignicola CBS 123094]